MVSSGTRLILSLAVLLSSLAKLSAQLNATELQLSCAKSLSPCQERYCTRLPSTPFLRARAASIGIGYNVKTDKGEGRFREQLRNRIFDFTYCSASSVSAPPPSAPVNLPCEALYDEFNPPIVEWNRDVRMFTNSEQYIRLRSGELGLTGNYDGITAKFGFSKSSGVQSLSKGKNYYALNDRRVIYGIVSIDDWRCYPFTPSFLGHLLSLHPTDPTHPSYGYFIAAYGHAFVAQVYLGGRAVAKATVDKCEAYNARTKGQSVKESAYQTLAKGLKVDLGGALNTSSSETESASVDIQEDTILGGDASLAGDDSTFFEYVRSVRSKQSAISVTEDNSLTPLYELLNANINLLNDSYDATYWKQVQNTLKTAIELDLQNSSDVDGDPPPVCTPTQVKPFNENIYFLFFLLVLPLVIIIYVVIKWCRK
eukprot:scpid60762/ scgid20844/ 